VSALTLNSARPAKQATTWNTLVTGIDISHNILWLRGDQKYK